MTAIAPRFLNYEDEPVAPGFERIARIAGAAAERVLDLDLEISPANQSLVDDDGGEPRRPGSWNAFKEAA